MNGILDDIKSGIRQFQVQPGFAVSAMLVLSFGIGATTTIFTVVDAVLLRPFDVSTNDDLVEIEGVSLSVQSEGEVFASVTPPIYEVAELTEVFTSVAAYASGGMNLTGVRVPTRVQVGLVTPNFFSTWQVEPLVGRSFLASEGESGGPRVAILSNRLWRSMFGADPAVVGRRVELTGREYEIVGIMPSGFGFPDGSDVWVPLRIPMSFADWEPFRQAVITHVIGRLVPGVSLAQANQRVKALFAQYEVPYGAAADSWGDVRPLRERLVGDSSKQLLVLFGATTLVLLITCASVANLFLSRSMARRQELRLRAVLGATSARIGRQLLTESLLLSSAGAVGGILIALVGLGMLTALVPPGLSGVTQLQLDRRILLFATGLALITGVGFGVWPAVAAARLNAGGQLRMGGTGVVSGGGSTRAQRLIVICELALAMVLLVASGVMLRSLQVLLERDSGVSAENVVTIELSLAATEYSVGERRVFVSEVLRGVEADAGVEAAAAVNELPLRGTGAVRMHVSAEGTARENGRMLFAQDLRISSNYFQALQIKMILGRTLMAPTDSVSSHEVVINKILADALWPGEDPVGKYLRFGALIGRHEVVGVVANVLPTALDGAPVPQVYSSIFEIPPPNVAFLARSRGLGSSIRSVLPRVVQDLDPGQTVYNARTMEEVIGSTLASRKTSTLLFMLFSGLGLFLATLGVYGIISYGVARRNKEIGIRMALGASAERVLKGVMLEGVAVSLSGILIGSIGAFVMARALTAVVYDVSPTDPTAFLIASAILIAVSAIATFVPARRASRVSPSEAMRSN